MDYFDLNNLNNESEFGHSILHYIQKCSHLPGSILSGISKFCDVLMLIKQPSFKVTWVHSTATMKCVIFSYHTINIENILMKLVSLVLMPELQNKTQINVSAYGSVPFPHDTYY